MLSISKIELSDGTAFNPGRLNVAIGPNNGGKSRFLADIAESIVTPRKPRQSAVEIDYSATHGWNEIMDRILDPDRHDDSGNLIYDGLAPDLTETKGGRTNPNFVTNVRLRVADDPGARIDLLEAVGFRLVAHLKTDSRLSLVKRQLNKNQGAFGPQSVLHAAYDAADEVLAWIDRRVHGAFGHHLLVDDTIFAEVGFRLSSAPEAPLERDERRAFMAPLPRVEEQGDGIRAFCGVLAAAKTTERLEVLIDEPEAFLHPPQAFLIGRAIAEMTQEGHQLFVATHSAEVLRGILSRTTDLEVIRLSQAGGHFSSALLEAAKLKRIADDPVLSSARVLDGLFYQGVIVTESDGDIALYRRVLETIDPSASIHFVNSYSKQTSARIAEPYHAMGVPCAIVVDFDMLRVGEEARHTVRAAGGDWAPLAAEYQAFAASIDAEDDPESRLAEVSDLLVKLTNELAAETGKEAARKALDRLRSRLKKVRESASAWAKLKRSGTEMLGEAGRAAFEKLDRDFRELGLFLVPVGEREGWLEPDVGYSAFKSKWTEDALIWLSKNELSKEHPLYKFMEAVRAFCLGEAPGDS